MVEATSGSAVPAESQDEVTSSPMNGEVEGTDFNNSVSPSCLDDSTAVANITADDVKLHVRLVLHFFNVYIWSLRLVISWH